MMDLGDGQTESHCEQQKASFPWRVAECGVKTTVQTADASRPEDKQNIMRILAGNKHRVNRSLRNKFRGPALWSRAFNGETDGVLEILRESTDCINYTEPGMQTTAVIQATYKGHAETVRALAELKADLDQGSHIGSSPMCYAAVRNKDSCARALVELKADLNLANFLITPLAIAATRRNEEVYDTLVRNNGSFCASNCCSSFTICFGSCLSWFVCGLCCCRACGYRGWAPAI